MAGVMERYMSSLCILKGNDVFKAAIAVAPVTNWKWYDSIYTERYMRTTTENAQGYADNSPVYFADRLKGNYLLIHGMAHDNVHFQNAVEMANVSSKPTNSLILTIIPTEITVSAEIMPPYISTQKQILFLKKSEIT
ncbi:MAG: prolyl oligopeptidase family serine peptidase, partial [Saprospiraceae bacterium]|nr:prolyl oligopeptidase family serine peptidase [Saprospiraceae bacterium]